MIITVTMNPAIDKTIELGKLIYGGLNRITCPVTDAGGKGINVSKTIRAFGGSTIACGLLGAKGSEVITECLDSLGIPQDFQIVPGNTRINTKLVEADGTLTELNEQGMSISASDIADLQDRLDQYAQKGNLFILAGSIPAGTDQSIYAGLTRRLKEKGASVFVDADGALFANAVEEIPTVIKPNDVELAEYLGRTGELQENELTEAGNRFLKKGIELVIISRGKEGALFLWKDKIIIGRGLKVPVRSTVGAGDAMVAAMSYAIWELGVSREEAVRMAMASSAGAVMTEGTNPPDLDLIEQLKKEVVIEVLVNEVC